MQAAPGISLSSRSASPKCRPITRQLIGTATALAEHGELPAGSSKLSKSSSASTGRGNAGLVLRAWHKQGNISLRTAVICPAQRGAETSEKTWTVPQLACHASAVGSDPAREQKWRHGCSAEERSCLCAQPEIPQ